MTVADLKITRDSDKGLTIHDVKGSGIVVSVISRDGAIFIEPYAWHSKRMAKIEKVGGRGIGHDYLRITTEDKPRTGKAGR